MSSQFSFAEGPQAVLAFVNSNIVPSSRLDHYYAAAAIVATIGLTGIMANVLAIWLVIKVRALRNCFGYLCLIHAVIGGALLLFLVFWAVPMMLLNDSDLAMGKVGRKVGYVVGWLYYATMYVHLCKAVNRLVAIANPMGYRRYFGTRQVFYLLCFVVVCASLHDSAYFFQGCEFWFDPTSFMWSFAPTPCGDIMSTYIDFIYGCAFMAVVVVIDVVTFSLIVVTRSRVHHNHTHRTRDIRFFLQTSATSFIHSLMLVSFHVTWRITSSPWILFLSTTVAWTTAHSCDGVLMIVFNARFRRANLIDSSKGHSFGKVTVTIVPTRRIP